MQDHRVLLRSEHSEGRRHVPGGLVLGVEGVRVVDAEDVALASVAADGQVGEVEEGVGEEVFAVGELEVGGSFFDFCGRFW